MIGDINLEIPLSVSLFAGVILLGILAVVLWRLRVEHIRSVGIEGSLRECEIRFQELYNTTFHYREVFEYTSNGIFLVDVLPSGEFRYAAFNPAEEHIIGIKDSYAAGKTPAECMPAKVAVEVTANFQKCLESDDTISYEEQLDFAVGKRYFFTTLIPIRDGDGTIRRILGVAQDISEGKLTEEELRNHRERLESMVEERTRELRLSEESYRSQFADNSCVMLLIDPDEGRIMDANARAISFYGYTREELLKMRISEINMLPHGAVIQAMRSIPMNQGAKFIFRHLLANGAIRDVEVSSSLIRYSDKYIIHSIIHDITERKQAEEALRESEERYRKLLLASPDGVTVVGLDGRVTDVSLKQLELYGHTNKQEIVGRSPLEWIDPSYRDKAVINMENAFDGIHSADNQYLLVKEDGKTFWGEIVVSTMVDKDENPYGMIAVTRDITERKLAEENLRKLYQAVEQSQASIVITDKDGLIEYVNPAFTRVTGYTRQEAYSNNPRVLKSGLHSAEFYADLWKTITAGNEWHGEFCNRKKGGTLYWESASIAPIRNEAGETTNYVAVKEDITEHKRKEEEIRRLAMVAQETENLVVITDANRSIEWVNPGFTRVTGYTLDEAVGRKPGSFLEGLETDSTIIQQIHEAIAACQGIRCEVLNYKKNGEKYWIDINIQPIFNELNKIERFIAIETDITKIKDVEEQLRKARDAAETANLAKSLFLANMSHEIRTPMNAILGFSQLLLHDEMLTDQQHERLHAINRSGEHLLELINDVLEMSKIEAGRITITPAPMDLFALISDLELMFRLRTDSKRLSFQIETEQDLPQYIVSDEKKLRQIFINLLGNALKFTESGGITWRTKAIRCQEDHYRLISEIEDSGIGIASAEISNLFEAFQQTSGGIKSGGTGLGLAISREFARLLGGDIFVKSELGGGSCFRVEVDVVISRDPFVSNARLNRRVLGIKDPVKTYRALIVDDRTENRDLSRELLRQIGFETEEAANGVIALKMIDGCDYDLILMDMRMPVLNGYETTRLIRQSEKTRSLPIIAVTASAFDDEKERVLNSGVNLYIRKPFKEEELYAAIQHCLDITYVYADEKVQVVAVQSFDENRKEIAGLPHILVEQIRSTTHAADLDRLLELILQVELITPKLGKHIRNLADNFNYDEISALFSDEIQPQNN